MTNYLLEKLDFFSCSNKLHFTKCIEFHLIGLLMKIIVYLLCAVFS